MVVGHAPDRKDALGGALVDRVSFWNSSRASELNTGPSTSTAMPPGRSVACRPVSTLDEESHPPNEWSDCTKPPAFRTGERLARALTSVFWLTPGRPAQPGVRFAGGSPQGLFVTHDDGVTWAPHDMIRDLSDSVGESDEITILQALSGG
jgi:hypothetical protein